MYQTSPTYFPFFYTSLSVVITHSQKKSIFQPYWVYFSTHKTNKNCIVGRPATDLGVIAYCMKSVGKALKGDQRQKNKPKTKGKGNGEDDAMVLYRVRTKKQFSDYIAF